MPGRVGGGRGLLCGGEGCFVNDYDDTKGTRMLGFCMFFSFFSISCVFSMDSSMYLGSTFTDFYAYIHDPILVVSS